MAWKMENVRALIERGEPTERATRALSWLWRRASADAAAAAVLSDLLDRPVVPRAWLDRLTVPVPLRDTVRLPLAKRAVSHPSCPPDLLDLIVRSYSRWGGRGQEGSATLRHLAAAHPALPAETLQWVQGQPDGDLRSAALANPGVGRAEIERALAEGDAVDMLHLVANPTLTPADDIRLLERVRGSAGALVAVAGLLLSRGEPEGLRVRPLTEPVAGALDEDVLRQILRVSVGTGLERALGASVSRRWLRQRLHDPARPACDEPWRAYVAVDATGALADLTAPGSLLPGRLGREGWIPLLGAAEREVRLAAGRTLGQSPSGR